MLWELLIGLAWLYVGAILLAGLLGGLRKLANWPRRLLRRARGR